MKLISKRKVSISIALLFVLIGIGMYLRLFTPIILRDQQSETVNEINTSENEPSELQKAFIDTFLKKLPDNYVVSEYEELIGPKPLKALEAKPCVSKDLPDPANMPAPVFSTYSEYCYPTLTLMMYKEKTKDLDEYMNSVDNTITDGTYGAFSMKNLVRATYGDEIPFFYTSISFMCPGTGAETCLRKKFLYHLKDGSNVGAEIRYWPFQDGKYTGKPAKEDEEIIQMYENILTKLSEDEVIELLKKKFAELRDYPSTDSPPKSIRTEVSSDTWYVAFIQEGSGRPIISAQCFEVKENSEIVKMSTFTPVIESTSLLSDFSPKMCGFKS